MTSVIEFATKIGTIGQAYFDERFVRNLFKHNYENSLTWKRQPVLTH